MNNSSSTSIRLPSSHEPIQQSNTVNNNTGLTNTVTSTTIAPTNTHTVETCDTNNSSAVDSCDDDFYYETQPRSLAALAERDRRREQLYLQKLAKKQHTEKQQKEQSVNNSNTSKDHSNVLVDSRGASLHANAIDSSSAMIVNESRVSNVENNAVPKRFSVNKNSNNNTNNLSAQQINTNKIGGNKIVTNDIRDNCANKNRRIEDGDSQNTENKQNNNKMEKSNVSAMNVPATGRPSTLPPKMNFDKKPKPGFLSRFTNFRFSLRGSKKKMKSFEHAVPPSNTSNNIVLVSTKSAPKTETTTIVKNSIDQVPMRNKTNNSSRAGCYQRNSMRSNEFEYIPLKDPIGVVFDTPNQTSDKNVTSPVNSSNNTAAATKNTVKNARNDNNVGGGGSSGKKNVLTSKPPLPRQPPRVVGLCAKQPSTMLNSTHPNYYQMGQKAATLSQSNPQREGVTKRHAQQQRSTSAPREINFDTTDNSKNFHYLANDDDYQLLSSRQANESISRGGLLKGAVSSDGLLMDVNENSFCTGDDDDEGDDDGKIGLIETNLDTDETVISGKTRSLMELGPQLAHRSAATTGQHRLGKHGAKGADPTTIEPRRPHKSMEFLLDKENQRFVLVSVDDFYNNKSICVERFVKTETETC